MPSISKTDCCSDRSIPPPSAYQEYLVTFACKLLTSQMIQRNACMRNQDEKGENLFLGDFYRLFGQNYEEKKKVLEKVHFLSVSFQLLKDENVITIL